MAIDRSKHVGILFDSTNVYECQDGKVYNPQTGEEVVPNFMKTPPRAPATPTAPAKTVETLKCKHCGKVYKAGTTEKSKALAIKRMEAHIRKEHSEVL